MQCSLAAQAATAGLKPALKTVSGHHARWQRQGPKSGLTHPPSPTLTRSLLPPCLQRAARSRGSMQVRAVASVEQAAAAAAKVRTAQLRESASAAAAAAACRAGRRPLARAPSRLLY